MRGEAGLGWMRTHSGKLVSLRRVSLYVIPVPDTQAPRNGRSPGFVLQFRAVRRPDYADAARAAPS